MSRLRATSPLRALLGALAVLVGVIACSGIITGPDAGPDTKPRSMRVTPPRLELSLTDTARMSANLYDVTGASAVLDPSIRILFRSADTLVARVDTAGLVTAIGNGTTTVTASYGALSLGIPVVVLGRPRIVIVSGDAQTAEQGDTLALPLVVRALHADGTPLDDGYVTFTVVSGNGTLASVQDLTDTNGRASARWVVGLPLGAQSVSVTRAGYDSAVFTATAMPGTRVARVAVDIARSTLAGAGDTTRASAVAFNVADVALPSASIAWVSSAIAVATVGPTGLVTAVAPGTTYIKAISGAESDSLLVTVVQLPKLSLGADTTLPSGLQNNGTVAFPAPPAGAPLVTVRSLDGTALLVSAQGAPAGATSAVVSGDSGDVSLTYVLMGLEGTAGRTATIVAESPGYEPDTMVVTLTRPGFLLNRGGGFAGSGVLVYPASGGEELTLLVRIGAYVAPGDFRDMPVRQGGTGPSFTLTSDAPTVAQLRFFSSPVTVGADQGPAAQVTFGIAAGNSGTYIGGESLMLARLGIAGLVTVTLAGPADYDAIIATTQFSLTAVAPPVIAATPTALNFATTAGAPSPAAQQVAITNSGPGTLSGLSASVAYGAGASDWLVAALDVTTAPATLTLTPSTGAIPAGSYSATVTIQSSVVGVAPVSITVSLAVAPSAPLPKLSLGSDAVVPAGLIRSNFMVQLPATAAGTVPVTLRSVDPTTLVVSPDAATLGTAQLVRSIAGGNTTSFFALQGIEGSMGRTALVVAEAAGYDPDTMVVTMVRPAAQLRRFGTQSVLASGGTDPFMTLTIGLDQGPEGVAAMPVRIGGPLMNFTVTSEAPALAQLRFFATSFTTGADQGPANAVTFAFGPGQATTSTVFAGLSSLTLARTGAIGDVLVRATGPSEYFWNSDTTRFTLMAEPLPVIVRTPTTLTFDAVAGAAAPASQTVAITNGGGATLSGLSALAFDPNGDPVGWISLAFDGTTAPATLTVTPDATGLAVGTYSATIALLSTVFEVNSAYVNVTLNVTAPPPLKLDLGADIAHPAQLQAERFVTIPAALFAPLMVTITTTDATGLVISSRAVVAGAQTDSVAVEGGTTTASYWMQGKVGGSGRTVTIIATAPGYQPDTMLVLMTRPVYTLSRVGAGTVPATGGEDPIFVLTVGEGFGDGGFTPMAVSPGTAPPEFTLQADQPAIARVQFFASAVTVGADQGPANSVTFALQPGQNSTSTGQFVGTPASLRAARTGVAGGAIIGVLAAPPEFDNVTSSVGFTFTAPVAPVIAVLPDSLGFTAPTQSASPVAQQVAVTNSGADTLSGLAADVLYGAGASDWLFTTLDATTAPTILRASASAEFLAPGTYTATIQISSTLPGVAPVDVPVVLTVTVGAPPVIGLVKISGDSQSVVVASALPAPLIVSLTDSTGAPVVGASVRWYALYGCCNLITDTTTVTDASGRASLSFTLPNIALPITVTVTSAGQPGSPQVFNVMSVPEPAVTLAFTLNTGGGTAGRTILPGWRIQARDRFANVDPSFSGPVSVVLANGPTALATLGGTKIKNAVNGIVDFDDLSVNVASTSWVLNASSPGLAGAQSAAFSIGIATRMTLLNTPLVPLGGTAVVRIETSVPSYGTGLVVGLQPSGAGIVSVNAPTSVTLPVGDSIADFTITGVANGFMFLNAIVDGSGAGQLGVTVSSNTISVPLTLNAPYTRTTSLPINLTQPAPAGGTTINVASANPSIVNVATPTVFIAAGTLSGNAQLEGVSLGQTAVTATGPSLATGTSTVTVTAALDLIESNLSINAGFSVATLTTRLLSGGSVFPAPSGGIPLTFTSRNTACVAAPAGISVPAGLNSVATTAAYGGSATTPCSTFVVVTSSSFAPDSVHITVNPPPLSYLSVGANIGAGLTRAASFSLQVVAPAGGVVVTLTSSDPTRLVLSPDQTTVGTASIDVSIPAGSYYATFYYSGIEGQAGTTAAISMSVAGGPYTNPAPATVNINPLGIEASGTTSMTTLAADGTGTVFLGELTPAGPSQSVNNEAIVRAGGQAITVTLTSSDVAVILPVTAGVAANPRTVTINPGQSRASYNIRPTGAGTASVSATSPSAGTPVRTGYPATVTVSAPLSYLSVGANIGAGLTRAASFSFQTVAPPGGIVVTLTSSDPTRLVLAPDQTTVGTTSIDVTIPAGSYYATFYYSGIEGQAGTTAQVSMVVQGGQYTNPATATVNINPLGIEASGTTSMTTLAADGSGTVFLGELTPAGPSQSVNNEAIIRAGGQAITVTLTSSDAAVILPVTAGVAANPRTVTIAPGQSRASYNIRPTGAGTAAISATSPSAGTPVRAGYPGTVTVTAPLTYLSVGATVGAGLTRAASFSFQSVAPAGGIVVTLTSSDPSRLVLAHNAATVGTASVDVTIPAGSYYATFYYSGIEGQAGTTAQISMAVQGGLYVNPAPATVTLNPLGVEANGSTSLTTLGADGSGVAYIGEITAAGPSQTVNNESIVRAGGQSVTVSLASTTPTVAVPVVGGVAGSPQTLTIAPGQSRANYGIRQLVAGTTTITATSTTAASPVRANYPAVLTVTSPSSSLSVPTRLGAGLAAGASVSLQVVAPVGGVTVTLTSSDPTRLLLAPDATTAGAAQITLPIAQGGYYTSFVVMALEDVTGNPTVTAQTPGFTDATGSTSVEPIGVQWSGTSSLTTLAGDGSGTAYVGIITGLAGNTNVSPEQVVRFGGVTRTITMTSSNTSVILPVVAGTAQQGITATILPGQSRVTVNVRPIGAGTATLAPSGNGLVAAAAPNVPQAVTVTVPLQYMSITSLSQGSGLSQAPTVSLQTAAPVGGRTMTLTSSDPSRLLLAPNASTAGAGQITLDFAAGAYYASFVTMSPESVTGGVTLTLSTPGYRDTTLTFTVVQPAVALNGPQPTRTLAQGDDWFQAQVGIPNGNGVQPQAVRFGAPSPLTVTLASSAPAIGSVVIGGVVGSPQTIEIPIGQSLTSSVIATRANFRPLSAGNTTITATIPGYVQQGNAIRTVTVSP